MAAVAVSASTPTPTTNPGQEKRRYDRRDGMIYNDRVEVDAHVNVILTQLARTSLLLHVRPSDLPSFGKYYFSTLGRAFGASRAPADLEQAFREKEQDLNRMFSAHVQQQRGGGPDVYLTDDEITTMRNTCISFARELIRYQLDFKDVWTFCEGYWKSLADSKLEYFLNQESKKAQARFKHKSILRPLAGGASAAVAAKRSSEPESGLSRTGTPTAGLASSGGGIPTGDSRAVTPAPPGTPKRSGSPVPGGGETTRPPTSSGRPGHARGSSMEVERGSLRKLSMDTAPNPNSNAQASAPSTPPGSGKHTPAPIAEAHEDNGTGTGSLKSSKPNTANGARGASSPSQPSSPARQGSSGSFDPTPIGSPPSGAQAGGLPPVRGKRGGIGARAVQQPSSSSRNNSGVMSAAAIAAASGPSPRSSPAAAPPSVEAEGEAPTPAASVAAAAAATIRPTSSGARAVTPLPPTAEGEERSVASPTAAAVSANIVADVNVSSAPPVGGDEAAAVVSANVDVSAEVATPVAAADNGNNNGEEGATPGEQ